MQDDWTVMGMVMNTKKTEQEKNVKKVKKKSMIFMKQIVDYMLETQLEHY